MAMTPGEQPRIGRDIAATRKSRTRNWPAQSTVYDRIDSLANYSASITGYVRGVGKGMTAGRNFLAYFNDKDDQPRLKYNVQTEHGRPKKLHPKYPHPSKNIIPAGTSLEEICQYYPLHVWADGLRIFMAENWTAEKIFRLLPEDTRNTGATARQWNYLQQAMGREADKMYEEDDNGPRVVTKRKRDDAESDEGVQAVNTTMPVEKRPRLTPQGANLPNQQPTAVTPQAITAPHIPVTNDDGFDWSTSAYQPAEMVAAAPNAFDYLLSTMPAVPALPEYPAQQEVDFEYNTYVNSSSWPSTSTSSISSNAQIPPVAFNEPTQHIQSQQENEVAVQIPTPSAAKDVVENTNAQEVVNIQGDKEDTVDDDDDDEDDDDDSEASDDSSDEESDDNSLDGDQYDDDEEETASNDDAFTAVEHIAFPGPTHEHPSGFDQATLPYPIKNNIPIVAPQPSQIMSQVPLCLEEVIALSERPAAYTNVGQDFTTFFTEPQYQAQHDYVDVAAPYYSCQADEGYVGASPESYYQAHDDYVAFTPDSFYAQDYYGQTMPYGGYDEFYFN